MERETDSSLLRRWQGYERQMAEARAGRLPPGVTADQFSEQLENERQVIEREWKEVLARRSRGELTDTTRTEEAMRIARDLCRFHGMDVTVDLEEMRPGGGHDFFYNWPMFVIPVDQGMDAKGWKQWEKVMEAMDKELAELSYATAFGSPAPFVSIKKDGMIRRGAMWIIDTQLWHGPPPSRRSKQDRGA